MKTSRTSKHIDFLETKCREHGLKVTPQRIAVYGEIARAQDHPTAEQVFRRIRKTLPHISFDTVNRTLVTFSQMGLIHPVEGSGRSRRFDPNVANHHHVHCVLCGKIIDFWSEDLDSLRVPKDIQQKFKILSKKVVINAVCEACRMQANSIKKEDGLVTTTNHTAE